MDRWKIIFALSLLEATISITLAANSEPLPQAAFESPDDLIVVVNGNVFPKNIDGSIRLADPTAGLTVNTCFMNDSSGIASAWQASLSDRKSRRALSALLNVPTHYAELGIADVLGKAKIGVRKALQPLLLGHRATNQSGQVRFACEEYWYDRDYGAAETAIRSGMGSGFALLLPAFFAVPLINELHAYGSSSSPEKFLPDQYLVIARIPFAQLKRDVLAAQERLTARQQQLESYREKAKENSEDHIGLLTFDRWTINPKVCTVAADARHDDAVAEYVASWRIRYRERLKIALIELGDRRAMNIDRSPDTGAVNVVADLNSAFIGMSTLPSCDAFVGPPAQIMAIHTALQSGSKAGLLLDEMTDIDTLLERFALTAGFQSYATLGFSRAIGATPEQTVSLASRGITDSATYAALTAEIQGSGYSDSPNLALIFTYLDDRRAGEMRGVSPIDERARRRAEDRQAAEALAERNRAEQAAFDAEYPYDIFIECSLGRRQTNIASCFIADTAGGSTQLELRTPDLYRMYQSFEVSQAGREIRGEGLKISVKAPFSIRLQNADKNLILTLKVLDKKSGQVIYTQSAAQYDVISFAY